MTATSTTATTATTATTKAGKFTFGPVWTKAVIARDAKIQKHQAKLVAHAIKLKVGRAYDLKKLRYETLLDKVATALAKAEVATEAVSESADPTTGDVGTAE